MGIRVLLADDHTIMREGLKFLLEQAADMEVVAQAANGLEALQLIEECRPDVVVMDLTMPKMGGIEATGRIVAAHPEIKVLALSMIQDKRSVVECMKAGASGYLLKDCAGKELLGAIRRVAAGEFYLCAKATELVISEATHHGNESRLLDSSSLTQREQEVLQMVADGNCTKEIAFALGVSGKTVDVHRSNIMKKLNLNNIVELTKYAIREGVTSIEP